MKKKKKLLILLLILALLVPTWYFNNYSLKLTEQTIYSSKVETILKLPSFPIFTVKSSARKTAK